MTESPVDPGRVLQDAYRQLSAAPARASTPAGGAPAGGVSAAAALRVGELVDFTVVALLRAEAGTAGRSELAGQMLRIATRHGLLDARSDLAIPVGAVRRARVVAVQPTRLSVLEAAPRVGRGAADPPSVPSALRGLLRSMVALQPELGGLRTAWQNSWQAILRGDVHAGQRLRELVVEGPGRPLVATLRAALGLARSGQGSPGQAAPGQTAFDSTAATTDSRARAGRPLPEGAEPGPDLRSALDGLRKAGSAAELRAAADRPVLQELALPSLPAGPSIESLRWFVGAAPDDTGEQGRARRADEGSFLVVVLVELSRLGAVRADLRFVGPASQRGVHLTMRARTAATADRLAAAQHELRDVVQELGLEVVVLQIRQAVCAEELTRGLPRSPSGSVGPGDNSGVDCHV